MSGTQRSSSQGNFEWNQLLGGKAPPATQTRDVGSTYTAGTPFVGTTSAYPANTTAYPMSTTAYPTSTTAYPTSAVGYPTSTVGYSAATVGAAFQGTAGTAAYPAASTAYFGGPTSAVVGGSTVVAGSRSAVGASTAFLGTPTPAGQQTVQSERVMSSTIVSEHQMGAAPEHSVQYVEVPVIEEVIKHVPKKEIVEIQKVVPRYEFEWVERVVEVPQIQYVDKQVEVPRYEEIIKHVPVKQVVDVPREVVRYVPKIETKIVEQHVEVAGETIEVPKPYTVENKVVVPRYVDREVPTIVAQRLHPVISESDTVFVDCELKEYYPQLIPVDVYIPKPVGRSLVAASRYEEHRIVDVPPAQFNALVRHLNVHITDSDSQAMYVRMSDGTIPMLQGVGSSIVPPMTNEWEKYHEKGQLHIAMIPGAVLPSLQTTGAVVGGQHLVGDRAVVGGHRYVGDRGVLPAQHVVSAQHVIPSVIPSQQVMHSQQYMPMRSQGSLTKLPGGVYTNPTVVPAFA